MTLQSLIAAIIREFPDALLSEVADALCMDDRAVSRAAKLAGMEARERRHTRRKDMKTVREIEKFAATAAGGEIEVIAKDRDRCVLCINGKMQEAA